MHGTCCKFKKKKHSIGMGAGSIKERGTDEKIGKILKAKMGIEFSLPLIQCYKKT